MCIRPSGTALAAAILCAVAQTRAAAPVTFENQVVRYVIRPDGTTGSFFDKRASKEYLAPAPRRPFALAKVAGKLRGSTGCSYRDGRLTLRFGNTHTATVRVTAHERYVVFEVIGVGQADVEELVLVNLPVKAGKYVSSMSGVAADETFAAAIHGCNLKVRTQVAGRPAVLSARCFGAYGLVGAKVALVGCPADQVRAVLKEVVRNEGLPYSPLGGPFALDAPENRGSYVFAHVSEKNVDDWIALAKTAGLAQIHFHAWWHSMGHYQPRKSLYPNGLGGLKAAVAKVHAAGMKAGMHTLTGCISPHDAWVRPRPDPRLAVDATFTLVADLDAKATTLPVGRPPRRFDTVWAYGGHGNVVRIDDELIHFTALSQEKPYAFAGCRRGAFGTKIAPHKKGAAVKHLFVRYGCFQPAAESTLVDDLAGRIAHVFNTCGFDMIYMDGAEGMIGGWHGVATMRRAIFRKLKRRVLVEASEWGRESWVFHSRLGAWDYPNWGLKAFIDSHCRATIQYRRLHLLPAQLGWWAIFGSNRHHDAELPDEVEYLCCKAMALDAPMSFQALAPGPRPQNARQEEYLAMIGRYERLRLSRHFSQAVRRRLAEPGAEFRLCRGPAGRWQLLPTDYAVHKVTGLPDGTDTWTVTNRFAAQPPALRIQALYSVEPYNSPDAVVLAEFRTEGELPVRRAARGVTHAFGPTTECVKVGKASGRYSARNTTRTRRGAWALAGKRFTPHADISRHDAIGLWIHGDGQGQLLNIQPASPRQYYRALDEHYVTIDFAGWRYVELLFRERDAGRYGNHVWPYPGHYYVYRAPLVRNHVSELNLYFNELPPGKNATCYLSPIKALRTRKVTLRNPSVQIAGKRVVFPAAVESGGYIEFRSMTDCALYDARGAIVQQVRPQGQPPALATGPNAIRFICEGPPGVAARARITVISHGPPLVDRKEKTPAAGKGSAKAAPVRR